MRIWHKDLIEVLPTQQLVAQWRECCAIARNIAIIGTPNHILVNRVMDYPISHFYNYTELVIKEMTKRQIAVTVSAHTKFVEYLEKIDKNYGEYVKYEIIFLNWHNDKYFWQCIYNLDEKYDCGGITDDEMKRIEDLSIFYV